MPHLDSPEFTFDPRVNRYRFKDSGQFVNASQFKALTTKLIKATRVEIEQLLQDRLTSKVPYEQWRSATLTKLKQLSIQTYILHRGGANKLQSGDLNQIQNHLSRQFNYFRNLAIKVRRQEIDQSEALRRLRLYIDNATIVRTVAETQNMATQYSYGFRVLGVAEHCPDCLRHAGKGILRTQDLIPPGVDCVCGSRCHCRLILLRDRNKAASEFEKVREKQGLPESAQFKPKEAAIIAFNKLPKLS